MVGLVKSDFPSSRQPDPADRAPPCFFHFRTADPLPLERSDFGLQICAHQVELVPRIIVRRMNGQLRWREREDQPAVAGVHGWKSKDLMEEGSISRRVGAVDDHVGAKDHESAPLALIMSKAASLQEPPGRRIRTRGRSKSANPGTLKRDEPGASRDKVASMAESSHGLLGRIQRANDDASRRFGPNTAEVEAFIEAAAHLTPWQWRQVLAVRRLVASVTKEGIGKASESRRSVQAAIGSTESGMSEPMVRTGEALFEALEKHTDEK